MHKISESLRLPSPAPRAQPIAFQGDTLWIGSWDTHRLYGLDPHTWTVREEAPGPAKPYGMTVVGDELRVVLGLEDDDRYIVRFVPGHGFRDEGKIECPDRTGSQLAFDGDTLFLSQLADRRILALDGGGNELHTIPLERKPCGMTIVEGCFFLLTGDDEMDEIRLTKVDARGKRPVATDLAMVPFDARGLAYDGTRFWTNHRDSNEIVAFSASD